MKAGIEIGGTFTDLVLVDDAGRLHTHKVPSTPADPGEGAAAGLAALLARAGVAPGALDALLHGSTVATNALIERRGARTGLLTTDGFTDVLLIGRQEKTDVYDMFYRKPAPLIGRGHIRGVVERIAADGGVTTPLDLDSVDRAIDALVGDLGVEAVAVCLLHAYRNPAHEQAIRDRVLAHHPGLRVSLSSDVSPEFREYERTSTTVISAYVHPVVDRYLGDFEARLEALGVPGRPMIMQSNGGVVPAARARSQPARMFLSGPAAGVTGAAVVAGRAGIGSLITIDVGGTSCDVCLVGADGPQMTVKGLAEYRIDGLPISLLMMDIVTLGAGGGSIVWVDEGGMMQVGPRSAGARPGPACYGHGGTDFTVTDALVLLGYIDPARFLGGAMAVDPALAAAAAAPLAARFDTTPVALAESVFRITVANIAQALRLVTVKRGRDPGDFALFPFGGAGPLLAAALAEEMEVATVLVPPAPGIFSAFGLSVADRRTDYVRSIPGTLASAADGAALAGAFEELRRDALDEFAGFGVDAGAVETTALVEARYVGQGYELRFAVDPEALARDGTGSLAAGFHAAHAERYGHAHEGQEVEVVSLRLIAVEPRRHALAGVGAGGLPPAGTRSLIFGGVALEAAVYERAGLGAGAAFQGPALVREDTSATLVPPGWAGRVDGHGILHLTRDREIRR